MHVRNLLFRTRLACPPALLNLSEQFKHSASWAETFEDATSGEKKIILARMIERIEMRRNYDIKIYFFISLEDFPEAVALNEGKGCFIGTSRRLKR